MAQHFRTIRARETLQSHRAVPKTGRTLQMAPEKVKAGEETPLHRSIPFALRPAAVDTGQARREERKKQEEEG
jgi:hypothetical protein